MSASLRGCIICASSLETRQWVRRAAHTRQVLCYVNRCVDAGETRMVMQKRDATRGGALRDRNLKAMWLFFSIHDARRTC